MGCRNTEPEEGCEGCKGCGSCDSCCCHDCCGCCEFKREHRCAPCLLPHFNWAYYPQPGHLYYTYPNTTATGTGTGNFTFVYDEGASDSS